MKLSELYEGDNNFKCVDNWLQGLLYYFKLYWVIGRDCNINQILVTRTCLKGKAEKWFNHKVKCLLHIVCNWTFKLVIVRLY